MALKAGVLIVGSLYWEDSPSRTSWRNSRLDLSAGLLATAPIRYGRRSEKTRGNTYTMVFSRGAEPGCARVIPFQHAISSAQELIDEAERLWTAERSATTSNNRISASWGCVALLQRPGLELPKGFLDEWADRVSIEPEYDRVPQTDDEGILVNKRGLLNIGWPQLIGSEDPINIDLVLATATHPSLAGKPLCYPSPAMIADAWARDTKDRIAYFRNNRANSICTFQDQAILAHLKQHFPALYATMSGESVPSACVDQPLAITCSRLGLRRWFRRSVCERLRRLVVSLFRLTCVVLCLIAQLR